jgi:hypothetical protein
MNNIKGILSWLGQRSVIIISVLIIGVGILLIWLISTYSSSKENIAIGIASISAFLAAISAIANLLSAVEVQKQRENNERPYIQGFFDTGNSGAIYFAIQNFGNSPAIDVVIKFGLAPIDYAKRPLGDVSLFSKPISFIAPGQCYRQLVNVGFVLLAEGNPTKFDYEISYYSASRHKFVENIETDLAYLKQATVPGKSVEEHLSSIHGDLDNLVKDFRSVKGFGSLLVESPDEESLRIQRSMIEKKGRSFLQRKLGSVCKL